MRRPRRPPVHIPGNRSLAAALVVMRWMDVCDAATSGMKACAGRDVIARPLRSGEQASLSVHKPCYRSEPEKGDLVRPPWP
jgi:hypothetical protein